MQDYKVTTIRTDTALTGTYVACDVLSDVYLKNQLIILVKYTKGSSDSIEIKAESSPDGTTYYQEFFGATTAGVTTLDPREYTYDTAGNIRIPIAIKDNYIKISVKASGVDLTGAKAEVKAVIGVA